MSEINDLNPNLTGDPPFVFANLPLGLPEIVWWLFAVTVLCAAGWYAAKLFRWWHDRLYEPSTHAALAAFFGFSGAYADSLNLDPSPFGQALMLTGAFFAFVGLMTREGR